MSHPPLKNTTDCSSCHVTEISGTEGTQPTTEEMLALVRARLLQLDQQEAAVSAPPSPSPRHDIDTYFFCPARPGTPEIATNETPGPIITSRLPDSLTSRTGSFTEYNENFVSTNDYDAVIIGGGATGMNLGGFLAKQRRKVLVLELSPFAGGRTAEFILTINGKDYPIPNGVHYSGNLSWGNDAGLINDIVTHNRRATDSDPLAWDFDHPVQQRFHISVRNGDTESFRDYTIPFGRKEFVAYLQEQFTDPKDKAAIAQYVKTIRYVNYLTRTWFLLKSVPNNSPLAPWRNHVYKRLSRYTDETTTGFLTKLGASTALIRVLTADWGLYGTNPADASFIVDAVVKDHYIVDGGYVPVGGPGEIAPHVRDVIRSGGGDYLVSARVAQLIFNEAGDRVIGVEMSDGRQIFVKKAAPWWVPCPYRFCPNYSRKRKRICCHLMNLFHKLHPILIFQLFWIFHLRSLKAQIEIAGLIFTLMKMAPCPRL